MKVLFAVLCAFVAVAFSSCPNVPVVNNFNVSLYVGRWYEIAASPLIKDTFERNCFCTNAIYGGTNVTGEVSVRNSCNKGSATGPLSVITGYAKQDPSNGAKLKVYLQGTPAAGNYWVVHVDLAPTQQQYQHALVWSCESIVVGKLEWVWVLSRNPSMTNETLQQLTQLAQNITGYPADKITRTVQQGCHYSKH